MYKSALSRARLSLSFSLSLFLSAGQKLEFLFICSPSPLLPVAQLRNEAQELAGELEGLARLLQAAVLLLPAPPLRRLGVALQVVYLKGKL
jgi:hypothetical protein